MALGIEPPWVVKKSEFDATEKRLDIHLDFAKRCYGASGEDKASSSLDTTDGDAPCRSRMT